MLKAKIVHDTLCPLKDTNRAYIVLSLQDNITVIVSSYLLHVEKPLFMF